MSSEKETINETFGNPAPAPHHLTQKRPFKQLRPPAARSFTGGRNHSPFPYSTLIS